MLRIVLVLLGAVLLSPRATLAQPTLNLSRDLVRLGIASSDLIPNQRSLDAGPLLLAGVEYAKRNGIPRIIADRGDYYFSSEQFPGRALTVYRASNLTIDFQGSQLFLSTQRLGLTFLECANVTAENFSIDYQPPPFTQVRVAAIDNSQRQLRYEVLPGWRNPVEFNSTQAAFGFLLFTFREGRSAPGVTHFEVQRPISGDRIVLANHSLPWEGPALSRIAPGDIAVLTARDFGEPILIESSDRFTLRNVRIYSSYGVGVYVLRSRRSLLERVYVMPRPGTDRMVSANADGISIEGGESNTVRLCRSLRALDDGFSPHILAYGTVQEKVTSRRLKIKRQYFTSFPNGVPVVFQSRTDGSVLGTATIVSQTPPPAQQPQYEQLVEVDFDRDLPDLPSGSVFYSSHPSERGDNTIIERSTVQDQSRARGITLWGLMNSTVRGNYVRNTNMAGILGTHRLSTRDWMVPPLEKVTIANNVIDGAITYGDSTSDRMAAIQLQATDSEFEPMKVSPHREVTVASNTIIDTPRSGIRVESVAGGFVRDNIIVNANANPNLDGYWHDTFEPYRSEFAQAVVIKTSPGVTSSGNVIESNIPEISVTSTDGRRLVAYAPSTVVNLSAANVGLEGSSASLTDASGQTQPMAIETALRDHIVARLPGNAALGAALITVRNGNRTFRGALFVDALDNFDSEPALPRRRPARR